MEYFMDRMFDFEAVKYKRFSKAANEDRVGLGQLAA
jgi:hypothetical protein